MGKHSIGGVLSALSTVGALTLAAGAAQNGGA